MPLENLSDITKQSAERRQSMPDRQTDSERLTYLEALLKVFDGIRRTGGGIVSVDFEGFQRGDPSSLAEVGVVVLCWTVRPNGMMSEQRWFYHYLVSDSKRTRRPHRLNIGHTVRAPLAEVVKSVRAIFEKLSTAGSQSLMVVHDKREDVACLEHIFGLPPVWLKPFEATARLPAPAPFCIADTQYLLSVYARVPMRVGLSKACAALGANDLVRPHNASNDAVATIELFCRLCQSIRQEVNRVEGAKQNPIVVES